MANDLTPTVNGDTVTFAGHALSIAEVDVLILRLRTARNEIDVNKRRAEEAARFDQERAKLVAAGCTNLEPATGRVWYWRDAQGHPWHRSSWGEGVPVACTRDVRGGPALEFLVRRGRKWRLLERGSDFYDVVAWRVVKAEVRDGE